MNKPFGSFVLGLLGLGVVLTILPLHVQAGNAADPDNIFVITKDFFNGSGTERVATPDGLFDLGYAMGEATAAKPRGEGKWELSPGYYGGGRLGTGTSIRVMDVVVAPGAKEIHQDNLRVGIAVNANVEIDFSDLIDTSSVITGVQVTRILDHLGQSRSDNVAITYQSDTALRRLFITGANDWEGNTLYQVTITAAMRSFSGYPVENETVVYFQTALDPKLTNVLLQPAGGLSAGSAAAGISGGGYSLSIPAESLADYAAILSTKQPLVAPLQVDPSILEEANRKAQAADPYRIPVTMREINAFDPQGNPLGRLTKPVSLTLGLDRSGAAGAISAAVIAHPQSLSLYTLDTKHHLWVKLPGAQWSPDGSGMTATVTQLSVFALMGSGTGSSADVYAYPNPWRPHGPKAGTGDGQTGTEAGGITFTNVPPECTIRIYTVSGELVREIHHSDLNGSQGFETWDVKTTHGSSVASGVYLWRVESDIDGKNGKLMVIR